MRTCSAAWAARYRLSCRNAKAHTKPNWLNFHNEKHQNRDLLERRNRRLEPNCSSFSAEKVLTS